MTNCFWGFNLDRKVVSFGIEDMPIVINKSLLALSANSGSTLVWVQSIPILTCIMHLNPDIDIEYLESMYKEINMLSNTNVSRVVMGFRIKREFIPLQDIVYWKKTKALIKAGRYYNLKNGRIFLEGVVNLNEYTNFSPRRIKITGR